MNSPIHVVSSLKLFTIFLVLFVASCSCFVESSTLVEDDIRCLKGVKSSLNDPEGKFVGVSCSWVFAVLSELIETGSLCYLSANELSGKIPPQLCSWLPYLVTLDLSNNDLTGSIPPELGNCIYLNTLILSNNLAAGVLGATVSLLLSFALDWKYHFRWVRKRKKGHRIERDDYCDWLEWLRAHHHVEVSLFKSPLVKVKLTDLMKATNNFNAEKNVIVSTREGTTYKALFHTCKLGKKQFRLEVNRLGQLKHPNLAILLGFCVAEEERLLVYKYISNGTLYSLLHGSNTELDWPIRFQIGLGAGRVLAWLFHDILSPFLHQNICSNVILVDEDFDARIMDLGLAKLMTSSYGSVYVNGDLGEFGYIAPAYLSNMIPSLKGDVYGLGKPLEISTAEEGFKGKLIDWVNQLSNSSKIKDAIDKALCEKGYDKKILQFLKIASNCVVFRPKDRWSMYQVHQSLNSIAKKHGFSEV
ncbi:hypothetical protein ACOSQ4_029373 [Xanthoceras sorbifolium]